MRNNWVFPLLVCALIISLLPACSQNNTPVPPTATQLPPTFTPVVPTATLPPPTMTPEPTRAPYVNLLIYDTPEMYQVTIQTVYYRTISEPAETLAMDIYYPPDRKADTLLPAVLIANAFPLNAPPLEGFSWSRTSNYFENWSRLIASNGLIAVAYDTLYPNDTEAVVKHIQQNSAELGIDGNRLGIFGSSSHAYLASSFAYQENREYLKFAVFYYGYIASPDNFMKEDNNAICAQYGCYGPKLPDIKLIRTDLPVLIVMCGNDAAINQTPLIRFTNLAKHEGAPVTLIRFAEGYHAFEYADTSFGDAKVKGLEILDQTIEFMKTNAFAQ